MSYHSENGDTHGIPAKVPRLLDEVRRVLRVKHYSLRTEKIYIGRIKRIILANAKRFFWGLAATTLDGKLARIVIEGGDLGVMTELLGDID